MEQGSTNFNEFINADTTFPAAIHAWEIHLADQGRSVYTIKAFRGDIQLMASYFQPDKTIGSVTLRDLNAFLDWMDKERRVPCSPKTYSRRITSIKAFYKWLKTYGIIEEDPSEKILQKSVKSPLPEILTSNEYGIILKTASEYLCQEKSDPRPMVLTQLLLATGIKKSETLGICLNHIEEDNPENPILHIRYSNPENRYKERQIDLPIEWIPLKNQYIKAYHIDDKLFPWSPRRLEYLLEEIGTKAGLKKHLSFSMCRWTCAVHDYYTGMDGHLIRTKLGVSNIQWSEINLKLNQLEPLYKAAPETN